MDPFVALVAGAVVISLGFYLFAVLDDRRRESRDARARIEVVQRLATIDPESLSPHERIQYDFERAFWGIQ